MVGRGNWVDKHLSKEDLKDIEKAVAQAEVKSAGEIVAVLINRSTPVGHVLPLLFLMLTSFLLLSGVEQKIKFYFDLGWGTEALGVIGVFLISYLLAKLDVVRRFLTSSEDMNREVIERAELEFYQSSIKSTAGQTGILLFISFMERQAVVLADRAISEKCDKNTWDETIRILINGIKQKNLKGGIVGGINHCSEILARQLPVPHKNENELSNHLIIKEH